ncbi:hypothetical protein JX265_001158 [Neoarthrinium moseri]|uniref:Zn(2)-C6 fungal-type domain-containing protein n=1 Tax=Neoarthrinium moseri TaxID=1658444 RepID=A0A9P9WX68_9PEZI|nr:hypothetical protein JX265_001158 [Neoarthrinium moseri]
MADPLRKVRKRQSAPKGRGGCLCCKLSHVRCFEEKPQCRRCQRLELDCTYAQTLSEPQRRRMKVPATPMSSKPNLSSYRPSLSSSDSPEVNYYAYHFRVSVAPTMNIGSLHSCSNFWLRTVPRETATNEGVRYFVVAIGALDRAMSQVETRKRLHMSTGPPISAWNNDYRTALRFYGRAIQIFRTEIADQERVIQPRTFLVYCMLQSLFESLQGNMVGFRIATRTGFEVLKHRVMQDQILIAAPLDDEGIEEAEVFLCRMVAVSYLMGPADEDAQRASITISVPIHAPMPDNNADALKVCRMFSAFYSRAVTWTMEYTKVITAGDSGSMRMTGEICIIIAQLREWLTCLRRRILIASSPVDVTRLQVHQLDAMFGIAIQKCLLYRCSLEAYTSDCLDILRLARQTVERATGGDPRYSRLQQGLLSEKLLPLVSRAVEKCPNQEYSSLTIAHLTPGGIDGKATQEGEFEPNLNHTVVGYSWDAQRNLFKVKLDTCSAYRAQWQYERFSAIEMTDHQATYSTLEVASPPRYLDSSAPERTYYSPEYSDNKIAVDATTDKYFVPQDVGLEYVPPTVESKSRSCFGLTRRKAWIVLIAAVVVIGALAGGIAGGLVNRNRAAAPDSAPVNTSPSASPTPSSPDATSTGPESGPLADSQLSSLNWTDSSGTQRRAVFYQLDGALFYSQKQGADGSWSAFNISGEFQRQKIDLSPRPGTALAAAAVSREDIDFGLSPFVATLYYVSNDNYLQEITCRDENLESSWSRGDLGKAELEAATNSRIAAMGYFCPNDNVAYLCNNNFAILYQASNQSIITTWGPSWTTTAQIDSGWAGAGLAMYPFVSSAGTNISDVSEIRFYYYSNPFIKMVYQNYQGRTQSTTPTISSQEVIDGIVPQVVASPRNFHSEAIVMSMDGSGKFAASFYQPDT